MLNGSEVEGARWPPRPRKRRRRCWETTPQDAPAAASGEGAAVAAAPKRLRHTDLHAAVTPTALQPSDGDALTVWETVCSYLTVEQLGALAATSRSLYSVARRQLALRRVVVLKSFPDCWARLGSLETMVQSLMYPCTRNLVLLAHTPRLGEVMMNAVRFAAGDSVPVRLIVAPRRRSRTRLQLHCGAVYQCELRELCRSARIPEHSDMVFRPWLDVGGAQDEGNTLCATMLPAQLFPPPPAQQLSPLLHNMTSVILSGRSLGKPFPLARLQGLSAGCSVHVSLNCSDLAHGSNGHADLAHICLFLTVHSMDGESTLSSSTPFPHTVALATGHLVVDPDAFAICYATYTNTYSSLAMVLETSTTYACHLIHRLAQLRRVAGHGGQQRPRGSRAVHRDWTATAAMWLDVAVLSTVIVPAINGALRQLPDTFCDDAGHCRCGALSHDATCPCVSSPPNSGRRIPNTSPLVDDRYMSEISGWLASLLLREVGGGGRRVAGSDFITASSILAAELAAARFCCVRSCPDPVFRVEDFILATLPPLEEEVAGVNRRHLRRVHLLPTTDPFACRCAPVKEQQQPTARACCWSRRVVDTPGMLVLVHLTTRYMLHTRGNCMVVGRLLSNFSHIMCPCDACVCAVAQLTPTKPVDIDSSTQTECLAIYMRLYANIRASTTAPEAAVYLAGTYLPIRLVTNIASCVLHLCVHERVYAHARFAYIFTERIHPIRPPIIEPLSTLWPLNDHRPTYHCTDIAVFVKCVELNASLLLA